jgi:4-amino-4-deoxy-L-arabinose transferase-like glycosyltransferase
MSPMHSDDPIANPSLFSPTKVLSQTRATWWQDIILLSLVLSIFFSLLFNFRPLSVPDEARYSEIPREMVVAGDYVTPRLNTIKYFEKPALFYWIQAGAIRLFGLSEGAVRLPTLLLGLIGCLIAYAGGRVLFDRRSGLLACGVLSTSILYFAMAHTITLDMAITVFLTGCLTSFILAIDRPKGMSRNVLLWAAYVFSGLAVLTKGLVGILLPVAIIGTWIVLCGQWRLILKMNLFSGALIFFAITVPWHVLVQQANPEFFHFYFLEQQFSRYFTLYAKRYQPDWFFIPILIAGFFPWVIFLFQSLRLHWPKTWKDRIAQKKPLFLVIWASVIFAFFSLSKSKLIPYILPVFPPLAMLVGHYLSVHLNEDKKVFRKEWLAILLGAIIIGMVLLAIPYFDEVNDLTLTRIFCGAMAFCVVTGAGLAMFYPAKASVKSGLTALFGSMAIFLILVNVAVAAVDTRSVKPLTMILNERLKPSDEVMAYHHYYQDLPFYVQRRVTVVDCCGELDFGMQHQDTHQFMIDETEFWKRWAGTKKVYAVMSLSVYEALKRKHPDLHLLASTKDNVLVVNGMIPICHSRVGALLSGESG